MKGLISKFQALTPKQLLKGAAIALAVIFGWGGIFYLNSLEDEANRGEAVVVEETGVNQAEAIAQFTELIREADPDKALVMSIQAGRMDGEVEITVADDWFTQSKQARLQTAQNFWQSWATLYSKNKPDSAFIKIVDANGNKVGGSGLAGSMISVDD